MEQKDPGPKRMSKSRSIDPSNQADEEYNLDEELVLILPKECTKVVPEPSDGSGPIQHLDGERQGFGPRTEYNVPSQASNLQVHVDPLILESTMRPLPPL